MSPVVEVLACRSEMPAGKKKGTFRSNLKSCRAKAGGRAPLSRGNVTEDAIEHSPFRVGFAGFEAWRRSSRRNGMAKGNERTGKKVVTGNFFHKYFEQRRRRGQRGGGEEDRARRRRPRQRRQHLLLFFLPLSRRNRWLRSEGSEGRGRLEGRRVVAVVLFYSELKG